jgi:hypothetical protein
MAACWPELDHARFEEGGRPLGEGWEPHREDGMEGKKVGTAV